MKLSLAELIRKKELEFEDFSNWLNETEELTELSKPEGLE